MTPLVNFSGGKVFSTLGHQEVTIADRVVLSLTSAIRVVSLFGYPIFFLNVLWLALNLLDWLIQLSPPLVPQQDGPSLPAAAPPIPPPTAPLLHPHEPGAEGGGSASPPPLPPLPPPCLPPGSDWGPQALSLPPLLYQHNRKTPALSSQGAGARGG